MVDVPELIGLLQSFREILHAENVKEILELQWSWLLLLARLINRQDVVFDE